MLSEKFSNTLNAADRRVEAQEMSSEVWRLFRNQMNSLIKQLEHFERTAEIGENGKKGDLPPNVVRIAEVLDRKGVRVGPRPVDGGAA